MSKKQKYSLTANQRKELRHKEETKVREEGVAEVAAKKKVGWWIIPLLICALALIVTAIVLPFTCSTYSGVKNPVAKIELSNGMNLEFEIYEDTCPIAATNFIFLARNRFFDGTIIYDSQNGWVRFGEFTSMQTYKTQDKNYMADLEGFYDNHADNKLGYRLYADTSSDAGRYGEEGMLTFNYLNSSCQFFMSSQSNCQTRVENSTADYTPTVVGRALNDQTLAHIKSIAELPRNEESPHSIWKNPLPTITIKSVKLYNLDGKKWRNFHFEDYMSKARENENTAISNWYSN